MIPIVGFSLAVGLAIFPAAIFAYAVDVNFEQLNRSYEYYESGRVAYSFHAYGENGVFKSEELENLQTSECVYENLPEGWEIKYLGGQQKGYQFCEGSIGNRPLYTITKDDQIVKYFAVKDR